MTKMNNEEKILSMLEKMDARFTQIDARFNQMDARLSKLEQGQTKMQEDISALKTSQGAMQETLTRVAITQENVVLPRIQLLAEGHTTIMDRMPSKSRIEALEEDVATLKSILQIHTADIAELKAAK